MSKKTLAAAAPDSASAAGPENAAAPAAKGRSKARAGEPTSAAPQHKAPARRHASIGSQSNKSARPAKTATASAGTAKPARDAKLPRHGKAAKGSPKPRPRLIRDSFTMPEGDFALIAALKSTALGAQRAAKKSELLRAGIRMLATLEAKALAAALDALAPVKTGRPKKGH